MKKKENVRPYPSAEQLQEALSSEGVSPARAALIALFDPDTFVETGAYVKRSYHDGIILGKDAELEGVITGYGAVDGQLVFAFAQDETRMKGAIDSRHAEKIVSLYDLALKKGAPVVGMFASSGADVCNGVTSMAAYGRILKTVADAADEILQIAYVRGTCIGTASAIASAFDFVVAKDDATFYAESPELGGHAAGNEASCFRGDDVSCIDFIKRLLDFIPDTTVTAKTTDELNRLLPPLSWSDDLRSSLAAVVDDGMLLELSKEYGNAILTAFASIGGVKCGILANDYAVGDGRITREAAEKASAFLDLCDAFSIPVVTFVNSLGIASDITMDAIRSLALSYARLGIPAVTMILDHAIGTSFVLMGSKSLGCDLVYTLSSSEIGVLPASGAVAFAWNDEITEETSRAELEAKWKENVASPVAAASTGEVDHIIAPEEIRTHIASALLMLTC